MPVNSQSQALKIACAILPNRLTLSYCLQQTPPIRTVPFYPGRLQLKAASAAPGSPGLGYFYWMAILLPTSAKPATRSQHFSRQMSQHEVAASKR